tara:strand:+ start:12829 stop:13059 length:231 start_codon:yes stop_codon:yes gene_type:complete
MVTKWSRISKIGFALPGLGSWLTKASVGFSGQKRPHCLGLPAMQRRRLVFTLPAVALFSGQVMNFSRVGLFGHEVE